MDLRIVKTHKAIRQAFIHLLAQYEYQEITIQDILDTALVNRATFYKYYAGKSDLAGQMIDEFKQQVQKILEDRLKADSQSLQIIMENHAKNMFDLRKQMLSLWKIRTKRHNLYQDMFHMMKQNFVDLAQRKHLFDDLPSNVDYQATMMATIFMASLQYYFEQDFPLPNNLTADWQQMIDIVKI